jgi:hypothetical protein
MLSLYQLTFPNGKVYIGQTVRKMSVRLAQHRAAAKRGSPLPVHNAWRKHGEPSVSILSEYDCQEALHKAEIDAIEKLNCLVPNGYNLAIGGGTAPSKSPEVAAKIAAKAKGRKHLDTSVWSEVLKIRWQDEGYREKVSEGLKASWDDEKRRKASERAKAMWAKRKKNGWEMPESTRQKLSKKDVSEETRAKMSESAKGRGARTHSRETRLKIAAATTAAWKDEELRARRLAAMMAAKKRAKNAAQEGLLQEDDQQEHQDRDEGWSASEAGGCDCPQCCS